MLVNSTLLILVAVLLFMYVLWANGLAVGKYSIKSLSEDLVRLRDENLTLSVQKDFAADPVLIKNFAQQNNMIEAQHASYIFENGNVALGH